MTTQTLAPPRPPTQLWGIWAVTRDRPDGFWWNHTNGPAQHAGTPMTFLSTDDAKATAEADSEWEDEATVLTVALIGVAPLALTGEGASG